MPFTANQIDQIAQAALDFHMDRGKVITNTIQEKPLYEKLVGKQKTFPGGKENITVRVKGDYSTTIQGFSADDTVTYGNPGNVKTATYPWKLIHSGITVTMDELLRDGISVVDSTAMKGEGTMHSEREKTMLFNLMADKIDDMMEGTERGMNLMFWRDGTSDSKLVPGIRSFIVNTPTAATVVAGIDQAANTWWRNRASLAIASNSGTWANQPLVQVLQSEWRQLRRYGGRPDTVLCGSDFLTAMEGELRAKGNYTLEGWTSKKSTDASIADISFKGVNFMYDPTLDDESLSKYCYVMDSRYIFPMVIDGEDSKMHAPARPENKYVFYKAMTWVGGLVCTRRNVHGVYSIA